jgi:hypothetical protein
MVRNPSVFADCLGYLPLRTGLIVMKFSSVLRVSLTAMTIVAMTALPSWARPARVIGASRDSQINVRDTYSTNSVVVAYAMGGEIVDVLDSRISEEDGYGWYKVKLENRAIGWVRADLLRFGVPTGGYGDGGGRGDDSDIGYMMRLNAGGAGNKSAVRSAPGFDANVSFYGRHGDRVMVKETFRNRDGLWYYVTYPNALPNVVSGGWVRRDVLVR